MSKAKEENLDSDIMVQFFRRSMGLQGITQSRLSKFKGLPENVGDPLLQERLEEFEDVTAQFSLSSTDKARLLLDHLAGAAREEVMCLPDEKRHNFDEVVSSLKLCFGYQETTQTLSSQFHSRRQQEGESLCDFSRALLRTYCRMVKSAGKEDQAALIQLKDHALCDQFVNGARDASVRRELRRIQLDHGKSGFNEVRSEALQLFQEAPMPQLKPKVREVEMEIAQTALTTVKPEQSVLKEILEQQKTILSEVERLKTDVTSLNETVRRLRTGKRKALKDTECYKCHKMGHYMKDCPQTDTAAFAKESGN